MRITYVTEYFPENNDLKFTGGIESAIYYLTKNLSSTEKITILYRPQKNKHSNLEINATLIPCGLPKLNMLINYVLYIYQLISKGTKIKSDIIIGTNYTTFIPAKIIGILTRTPVALMYADVLIGRWNSSFNFPLNLIGELIERITLTIPYNALLPISNTTAKLLKQYKPRTKIINCYLGVDIDEIKKNKRLKNSQPNILTISRLVSYKRLQDLIHAITILKNKHPSITCEIIGTGKYYSSLKKLIDYNHLNHHVKLLGHLPRSQVIFKLHQSKIFCLPSSIEGFGLVTLEAMAARTPFVNSDIPVTREITKNGQGGLLYQIANPDDLAQKIDLLLTDSKLYAKKQKQAVYLSNQFNWSKIAQKTLRIYTDIINIK